MTFNRRALRWVFAYLIVFALAARLTDAGASATGALLIAGIVVAVGYGLVMAGRSLGRPQVDALRSTTEARPMATLEERQRKEDLDDQRAWRDWRRVEECLYFGARQWGLTAAALWAAEKYLSPV